MKSNPRPISPLHSQPNLASSPLGLHIKRRHQVAAAAAALSLAGCGMVGHPTAAPASPEQLDAQRKVKTFQSDIEYALDKVDQDRLRAAAQSNNMPQVTFTVPASPATLAAATQAVPPNAVAPVSAPKPTGGGTAGSGAPVVEASAPAPAPKALAAVPHAVEPVVTVTTMATPVTDPAPVAPAGPGGVVAAPLSGDGDVSYAVIAPFTPPATPGVSAMGAMSAAAPTQAVAADPVAAPAAPVEPSVDDALGTIRKSIDEHPTLNTALALALLDGDKQGDAFKKLSESDQKLATDLLAALEAMKARSSAPTLADRAAPLLDAAQGWHDTADLALPRMVLATRVDSFGVFTPINPSFEQGKRHTVIIYCEVANFRSLKGDDGWYTTKLSQQETLFTEDGLLVWRPNPEDVEDRSLNQRHDFYLVKKLTIPETLAAGKYTLRMSVTDRTANKIKIVEMPIEIAIKDSATASATPAH